MVTEAPPAKREDGKQQTTIKRVAARRKSNQRRLGYASAESAKTTIKRVLARRDQQVPWLSSLGREREDINQERRQGARRKQSEKSWLGASR